MDKEVGETEEEEAKEGRRKEALKGQLLVALKRSVVRDPEKGSSGWRTKSHHVLTFLQEVEYFLSYIHAIFLRADHSSMLKVEAADMVPLKHDTCLPNCTAPHSR
jgi:hypothetical protein